MTATIAPPTDPAAIRSATIRIADYAAHPANYNQHSPDQIARLARSLQTFGQTKPVVVWRSWFLAGHGLRAAALALGWSELDARIVPDEWDEAKARAYLIADNRLAQLAEPDDSQLAALLQELDAEDAGLRLAAGYEDAELAELLALVEPPADNNYSRKIESPVYTPKGDKPQIADLFDTTRTAQLIVAIDAAPDVSEPDKTFLRIAAQRHTVLNFSRVAEYYAHADVGLQRLMEDSALVIIDFNRAIELGYVRLAQEIGEQYGVDYGGG